jgi:hypothetical protein
MEQQRKKSEHFEEKSSKIHFIKQRRYEPILMLLGKSRKTKGNLLR